MLRVTQLRRQSQKSNPSCLTWKIAGVKEALDWDVQEMGTVGGGSPSPYSGEEGSLQDLCNPFLAQTASSGLEIFLNKAAEIGLLWWSEVIGGLGEDGSGKGPLT